jgi:hypothetical protein
MSAMEGMTKDMAYIPPSPPKEPRPEGAGGALSSSLLARRNKVLMEVDCPKKEETPAQTGTARSPVKTPLFDLAKEIMSPVRVVKMAGDALQSLADMSPVVGAAGRALINKVMNRRKCYEATRSKAYLPDQNNDLVAKDDTGREQEVISDSSFVKLIYRVGRSVRTKREEKGAVFCSYRTFKEVAAEIVHATKVCRHVRRFIAVAKTSEGKSRDEPMVDKNGPIPEENEAEDTESGSKRRLTERRPSVPDEDWQNLLSGLSPMSPKIEWSREEEPAPIVAPPKTTVKGFLRKCEKRRTIPTPMTSNGRKRLSRSTTCESTQEPAI